MFREIKMTLFYVFLRFLMFFASQAVAEQELPSILTLQKKSYLKPYRRFFVFGASW